MKSIYVVLFAALFNLNTIAQSINDYKYVIVPDIFSWAGTADKHQVNSLTTFLFKKYGFDAHQLSEVLPSDMNVGGCNSLRADVEEDRSSFIRTKLEVVLKNCKGDIVFISEEGTSKNKDYKKAYHEALRKAFISIKELEYSYTNDRTSGQDSLPGINETKIIKENITDETLVQGTPQDTLEEKITSQKAYKKSYISLDEAYLITVFEDVITFYEGDKEIGTSYKKAINLYQVETTQFTGEGYFINNQFIVERQIRGVQGPVKMIFKKV